MCVAAAGAIFGAISSIMQGQAQAAMADYQAKVAHINSVSAVQEGFAQAGATRDQYREAEGSQRASLAKAGVDINTGTAATLQYEATRREEHAAAVDIWRGHTEQTKYLNEETGFKAEAKADRTAGFINGIGSLIGGISGMGSQGAGKPVGLGTAGYGGISSGSSYGPNFLYLNPKTGMFGGGV